MGALLIPGTDSWHPNQPSYRDWYTHNSPFRLMLQEHGITPLSGEQGYADFIWSTEADGLPSFINHGDGPRNWWASGLSLCQYLVPKRCPDARVPSKDTNLIAHSHAGQVVFYACANGLKVNELITVCSPVRADMQAVINAARPNIKHWIQLHSDESDHTQIAGSLFDGRIGAERGFKQADLNVKIPGVGHSGLLHDPEQFPLWIERGWLAGFK